MLKRIQAWDNSILDKIASKRTERLNRIMVFATTIGNHGYVWFAFSIPFLIMDKWRSTGFTVLVAMCLAWLGGEITIKHLVGRVRPCHKVCEEQLLIKNPPHYSFPSGHTTSSFAVATVMVFLCPMLALPTFLLACLIAFSRTYLLVHYPTDVLAGVAFGIICGCIAVPLTEIIPIFHFQIWK